MKGGYQILDLRCVGLEMSSETQNFTNEEVLKQLRNLRDHIEKEHAYAKPLRNGLKAIMIRYRDAKSGELLEMCGFADIISSNKSLTYEIIAKDLRIEIVFEEKTDEVGNKYFDIKTAKYLYNKDVIIEGNLNVASINGEENPSVKPIYFHGIDMYDSGNNSVQLHILNNSNESINTITKFKEWIEGIDDQVLVPLTGRIVINEYPCIALFVKKRDDNTYEIRGLDTTNNFVSDSNANLASYFEVVEDNVNKIN